MNSFVPILLAMGMGSAMSDVMPSGNAGGGNAAQPRDSSSYASQNIVTNGGWETPTYSTAPFASKGSFVNDVTKFCDLSYPHSPSVTLNWLFYIPL